MDDKQTRYELLERYLAGDLSVVEAKQFEEQLANDPTLQEDLVLHQELQASLGDRKAEQVEQRIKTIGQDFLGDQAAKSDTKIVPLWRKLSVVAAAVLVLVVLAFVLRLYLSEASSPAQLYATYYETPELLTINRSTNNVAAPILLKAYQAYEAENYKQASQFFSEQATEKTLAIIDQYYWGISLLTQPEPDLDRSISLLQAVANEKNNLYADAARWYAALAWLKKGDQVQARVMLQAIQRTGSGKYLPKAESLLEELKE